MKGPIWIGNRGIKSAEEHLGAPAANRERWADLQARHIEEKHSKSLLERRKKVGKRLEKD